MSVGFQGEKIYKHFCQQCFIQYRRSLNSHFELALLPSFTTYNWSSYLLFFQLFFLFGNTKWLSTGCGFLFPSCTVQVLYEIGGTVFCLVKIAATSSQIRFSNFKPFCNIVLSNSYNLFIVWRTVPLTMLILRRICISYCIYGYAYVCNPLRKTLKYINFSELIVCDKLSNFFDTGSSVLVLTIILVSCKVIQWRLLAANLIK